MVLVVRQAAIAFAMEHETLSQEEYDVFTAVFHGDRYRFDLPTTTIADETSTHHFRSCADWIYAPIRFRYMHKRNPDLTSSLKDVADVHYPKLSWLVPPTKLDSVTQIVRYHGPLLQSHGTADRTIPFSSGEKLFQAAKEPKTFVKIPGADHNNWLIGDYLTQLDDFIGRQASEASPTSN